MEKYGTPYSNWQRDNDDKAITGLHFVKTDSFYPQDLSGINLIKCDEHILKEIQSKICPINYDIPRRPVHGLHFSKNQKFSIQLKLCDKFINEMNSYNDRFKMFLESNEYEAVKNCNTDLINDYIVTFIKYYNEKEHTNSNI